MTQSGHYAAQRRELRVYTVCTWVHMLMELLFIWGHYPPSPAKAMPAGVGG